MTHSQLTGWLSLGAGLISFIIGVSGGILFPDLDYSGFPSRVWLYSGFIAIISGLIALFSSSQKQERIVAVFGIALGILGLLVILFSIGI